MGSCQHHIIVGITDNTGEGREVGEEWKRPLEGLTKCHHVIIRVRLCGVFVGDLLEATIQGQTIVLKPKEVVDRVQARQQLIEVMDRVHAKLPPSNKDPKEEEEEIVREIKTYRREHAQRRR